MACGTIESCQDYIVNDIVNGNRFEQLDQLLISSFENGGKDLSNILSVLKDLMNADKSWMRFMKEFFSKYFMGLSEDERDRRIRFFLEYDCVILVQFLAVFDIFQKIDGTKYLPYAKDHFIKQIIENEIRVAKESIELKKECDRVDLDEEIKLPMKRERITFTKMSQVFKPSDLTLESRSLFQEKQGWINLHQNKNLFGIESVIQTSPEIDKEWMRECNEYLMNLSIMDLFTLKGYTFGGEFINTYLWQYKSGKDDEGLLRYVNQHMRNPFIISVSGKPYHPYFFQERDVIMEMSQEELRELTGLTEMDVRMISNQDYGVSYEYLGEKIRDLSVRFDVKFWRKVFDKYAEDLERVILSSPPLRKELRVYRGSSSHYYSNRKSDVFKNYTFTSTAFYSPVVDKFAQSYFGCCITEFILKRGARCVWLDPISSVEGEMEILLPPHQSFVIESKMAIKYIPDPASLFAEYISKEEFESLYEVSNGGEGLRRRVKRSEVCSPREVDRVDYTVMRQI